MRFKILISCSLLVSGLAVAPVHAQQLIDSYTAIIGREDHVNSKGAPLKGVGAFLTQDRANVNRFNKLQPGDEPDSYFTSLERRRQLIGMLKAGSIDPAARAAVESGNGQAVRVEIYGNGGNGSHIKVSIPQPVVAEPAAPPPAPALPQTPATQRTQSASAPAVQTGETAATPDPAAVAELDPDNITVTNYVFPSYRLPVLKGHALTSDHFESWRAWYRSIVPVLYPELIDRTDIGAFMAAYALLSPAEKQALETRLNLPFPLFEKPEDYQVPITVVTQQELDTTAYRLMERKYRQTLNQVQHKAELLLAKRLDEFSKPKVMQALRDTLRAKIATLPRPLPLPIVERDGFSLGDYDFERKGFPIDIPESGNKFDKIAERRPSTRIDNLMRTQIELGVLSDILEYPNFLPMEPDEAEKLLQKFSTQKNGQHRKIYLGTFSTLTGVTEFPGPNPIRNGLVLTSVGKRFELATDPDLQNVLYTFYPDRLDSGEVADIAQAGQSDIPTLFDFEYLYASLADQIPGMLEYKPLLPDMYHDRSKMEVADFSLYGLDPAMISRINRKEVIDGSRKVTEDDIKGYRAFLESRPAPQPGSPIVVPVADNVYRDKENGIKRLEAETPADLIRAAFLQNGSRFEKYLTDRFQTLDLDDDDLPFPAGTEVFAAGKVADGNGNRYPVFFTTDVPNPVMNRAIVLPEGLRTPDGTNYGGHVPFETGFESASTIGGYAVLELKRAPRIFDGTDTPIRGPFVLFETTPKEIVLMDKGEPIRIDLNAQDPSKAGISMPASLPLDAETSDLLVVRHMPESLTDADYERMLLGRWYYEASFNDSGDTPRFGRFFDYRQPKPDKAQAAALVPAFRDWAQSLAGMLPDRFVLNFARVYAGQPGIAGLAQPFPQQTIPNRYGRGCDSTLAALKRQDGTPENMILMTANACSYLNHTEAQPPNIGFFGHPEYLTRQARAQWSPSLAGQGVSRHGTVGLRSNCRLGGDDIYCQGMRKEIIDGWFADTLFALDDAYVFDKAISFDQADLDYDAKNDPAFQIEVGVDGIVRQDMAPETPAEMAFAEINAFLVEQGVLETPTRDSYSRPRDIAPTYFFDLSVRNARFIDRKTGAPLRDLSLVDAVTEPDPKLLVAIEREYAAAPSGAYGLDMIGLRLGMSFDEADRIIREHMDVGLALVADRSWSPYAATGQFRVFTSGRVYESADGREVIAIYDEPPSAPGVVMGAIRQVVFEKGKVKPGQVFASIQKKYGTPTHTDGVTMAWGDHAKTCTPFSAADQAYASWRDENGAKVRWQPGTFRNSRVPAPASQDPLSHRNWSECGPGLAATFDTHENNTWDRLVFRLHDKASYIEHFRQSGEMIEKGGTFDPAGGGEEEEIDLDL